MSLNIVNYTGPSDMCEFPGQQSVLPAPRRQRVAAVDNHGANSTTS